MFWVVFFSDLNRKNDHKLLLEGLHMKTMIGALLDGGLLTEQDKGGAARSGGGGGWMDRWMQNQGISQLCLEATKLGKT